MISTFDHIRITGCGLESGSIGFFKLRDDHCIQAGTTSVGNLFKHIVKRIGKTQFCSFHLFLQGLWNRAKAQGHFSTIDKGIQVGRDRFVSIAQPAAAKIETIQEFFKLRFLPKIKIESTDFPFDQKSEDYVLILFEFGLEIGASFDGCKSDCLYGLHDISFVGDALPY